jgi:hypothetical protein
MNALATEVKTSVKVIGSNGQISLGKDYAGRQVLVEEREPGVWFVRTAIVIPENERWLHEPQAASSLQTALAWTAKNKPQETNIDTLFDGMNHGTQSTKNATKPARQARPKQSRVSKEPA